MGHFHILKCVEMKFPVSREKNYLVTDEVSPFNFSINPLKNHRMLKKK